MKKLIVKLALAALLLATIVFSINSCGNKSFVDLQKVEIPEYTASDYLALLDNDDDDIVYNSIANLIDDASEYGKILSSDTIKDSIQYNLAKNAYTKVSSCLSSGNEWVVCAAVRFLTHFGTEYKNKEEVAEKLLQIKRVTKSIQLEIINGFKNIGSYNSEGYPDKVQEFLKQKSWLISRFAYPLVNTTQNKDLANQLIQQYKKTNVDYEKLLIIEAVRHNFGDTIFSFFKNEIASSDNKKIRLFIVKSLELGENSTEIIKWVKANYNVLEKDKDEIVRHYASNMTSKVGSEILNTLLEHGFDPQTVLSDENEPVLYKELTNKLFSFKNQTDLKDEDKEKLNNLQNLEATVIEFRGNEWQSFKEKYESPELPAELIAKHKQQMDEMVRKTKDLFDQYKVDNKIKEEYVSKLQSIEKELQK